MPKLIWEKKLIEARYIYNEYLKSIKSEQKRNRIICDSFNYIRFLSSKLDFADAAKEINKVSDDLKISNKILIQLENNALKRFLNNELNFDLKVSIKQLLALFKTQILIIIKFIRSKKKFKGISLNIMISFNYDNLKHFNNKPLNEYIDIILPIKLILLFHNFRFLNYPNNSQIRSFEIKNTEIDILYKKKIQSYLYIENIAKKIINFINSIQRFNFIRKVECISCHQRYLENYLANNKFINSKKWKGVNITLHGGNYGITLGYPVMWYHCFEKPITNLNMYLPEVLFSHLKIDSKHINNINRSYLRKQYGFSLFNDKKKSLENYYLENSLFIFGPNMYPQRDSGLINKFDFTLNESMKRWHEVQENWSKGDVHIILRPTCYEYLKNVCKNKIKNLNLNLTKYSSSLNINNCILIFEGPSSAIREHFLKGYKSILFLPDKVFRLSRENYIFKFGLNKKYYSIQYKKNYLLSEVNFLNNQVH